MYEVEVKVRADHDAVRERLRALDATPQGTVRQVDTYYDAPHRDFAETDEALRVRRERPLDGSDRVNADHPHAATTDPEAGGRSTAETRLTYKGPLVDQVSKTREEHETAVASVDELGAILDGLGFSPAAEVAKERERYRVEGYTVTLDDVEGLGTFVEVEREVDKDRVPEVRDGARELLRDLGLDPDRGIRTSYLGLLLDAE